MSELSKALRAAVGRRVLRIAFEPSGLVLTAVESRRRDRLYLVIPGRFCSCSDFLINVYLREVKESCYHLVAYELAEMKGLVREIRCRDEDFEKYFKMIVRGLLL